MIPISLYVHIPFCEVKCGYCDFFSVPRGYEDFDLQKEYVERLTDEIDRRSPAFSGRPVRSIFFGGGTPSLLDPKLIERIFTSLQRHFSWGPEIEITLESNPKTVSSERLSNFRSLGINRLSIGVQSFQDRFLQVMGRIHSGPEARRTVEEARGVGFENISIDLIYALPGQSLSDWQRDLEEALRLETPHLSAYYLTIEPGTPFASLAQKGRLPLPSEDEGVRFLTWTRERLSASGGQMEPYEISNFSTRGFESVHNQNYWRYGEYLGFGTAAASFTKTGDKAPSAAVFGERKGVERFSFGVRRTNCRDLKKYLGGQWDGFTESIDLPTAMGEFCMLALRTREGIRPDTFQQEFGENFLQVYGREISRWGQRGYLKAAEGCWHLTPVGILFADEVAQSFLILEPSRR